MYGLCVFVLFVCDVLKFESAALACGEVHVLRYLFRF